MSEMIEIPHSYELISFEVHRTEIKLKFGDVVVDMHDQIEIISPDGTVDMIDEVWTHKGDLNALWPLIGRRMDKVVMDEESFRIIFEDGTIIRRKFELRNEVVNVWGPGPNEFTRYPDDLGDSGVTPEMKQAILNAIFRRPPED